MSDLHDAKEYGSILTVAPVDFAALYARVEEVQNDISLHREAALATILPLIRVAEVLAQKYDVVVTNPPYIGGRNMNKKLLDKICKEYPEGKADLFSAFISKTLEMTKPFRFTAMITQHSWMFLSSFEDLRRHLLGVNFSNMCHLGSRAFEEISGEVVQTTTWVTQKSKTSGYKSSFVRLVNFDSQISKEVAYLSKEAPIFYIPTKQFEDIPGEAFAYWLANPKVFKQGKLLEEVANPRQGLKTLDNDYFIHFWHEVRWDSLCFSAKNAEDAQHSKRKWFPINHGGEYRRYYGNNYTVVNWYNNGAEMKANAIRKYNSVTRTITNIPYYFREGITWSVICSQPSFRWYGQGFIFSNGGQCVVPDQPLNLKYLVGLLNSKVTGYLLNILSPTLGFESGYLKKIPIIEDNNSKTVVEEIAEKNITNSKTDWDSYEISWDFHRHPLLRPVTSLSVAYTAWQTECEQRFLQLKVNEEEINRIFIDIYGLQDELTPEVTDKDITVHRIYDTKDDVPESMQSSSYVRTKRDEVVSLLSYAVGCMFGRYSLDVDGLAYAGGEWDSEKYKTFLPDRDGILPITDEEYMEDDIVSRLCDWLKAAYGADTLEENLDFIAGALGGKGNSSREIIRNYFLKDFFKDHCKTYQKRPIYWLFDSGKQNGFKALIYLHRYTTDTIGNLRVDYLHKIQRVYESEINRMQDMIDHSTNAREVAASAKRKEKLQKQLKECRDYDEMIAHLALSRTELDLDDGVKVNYEKIQTASDGKKYAVLAKI